MGELLALTAGGHLPEVTDGTAQPPSHRPVVARRWSPTTSVSPTRRAPAGRRRRRPRGRGRPRRPRRPGLAGCLRLHRCGRGPARPGPPRPPHHRGHDLPTEACELQIAATRAGVVDTTAGQVISVDVRISATARSLVATPQRALHGARTHRLGRAGRPGLGRQPTPRTSRARGSTGSPSPRRPTWAPSPRSAATTTRCTPTSPRPGSRASTARSCTACGSRPSRSARPRPWAPPTTRAPIRSWLARWVAPLLPGRRGGDHRRAHRRRRRRHRRRGRPAAPTASW